MKRDALALHARPPPKKSQSVSTGWTLKLWSQESGLAPRSLLPPRLSRWRPPRWCYCPAGVGKRAWPWWRSRSGIPGSGFASRRCPRTWRRTDVASSPLWSLKDGGQTNRNRSQAPARVEMTLFDPFSVVALTCSWGALSALAALFAASVERETLKHLHTHDGAVCRKRNRKRIVKRNDTRYDLHRHERRPPLPPARVTLSCYSDSLSVWTRPKLPCLLHRLTA